MWMPAASSAGATDLVYTASWSSAQPLVRPRKRSRRSRVVSPSGERSLSPVSTFWASTAPRTWKNSSRLWAAMAKNLARSSTGTPSSDASASTRRLKSSHATSRLRYRGAASCLSPSGSVGAADVPARESAMWPLCTAAPATDAALPLPIRGSDVTSAPRAVADIGSNSARLLVVRPTEQGHLDVLADARVALRLMRDVDANGRLSRAALNRTVQTLTAFATIARRHGARAVSVVATSAVRDAANRDGFVTEAQRRTGLSITVLSGEDEARLALVGAVSGLPVDSGAVVDLGGGSMEVAAFARRRFRAGITLPLGALRLGDAFLRHDPPRPDELAALREHVRAALGAIDITDLAQAESLVGTGGTIRALAKAARGAGPAPANPVDG